MNKGKKWQLDMIQIESEHNKRARISIIKKRETPAPRNEYDHTTPEQHKKVSENPWMCECRVVRSDLMSVCVCVKEKVFVHNNANNNKMITEMKQAE